MSEQQGSPVSDSWEALSQTTDTDAVIAGWGFRPLWSVSDLDDTPPTQQENDQQ